MCQRSPPDAFRTAQASVRSHTVWLHPGVYQVKRLYGNKTDSASCVKNGHVHIFDIKMHQYVLLNTMIACLICLKLMKELFLFQFPSMIVPLITQALGMCPYTCRKLTQQCLIHCLRIHGRFQRERICLWRSVFRLTSQSLYTVLWSVCVDLDWFNVTLSNTRWKGGVRRIRAAD